ncbi:MAG: polysaccharide deacetylase family protein [Clostridia bacterium]|nr:polysaccharide deacetylase family protein [Clostridia bacterium]
MRQVIFTWDDNFLRHALLTAPVFGKYGFKCTFYAIPGEAGFEEKYAGAFCELAKCGFEVGSHGYTHDDFTKMTLDEAKENMTRSIAAIEKCTGKKPRTFAFPYHRYTEDLLGAAKEYFIETRNTLCGAERVDILGKTTFEEMKAHIDSGKTIVFAGHASFFEGEKIAEMRGYEPIDIVTLEKCLAYLKGKGIRVVTMEEAAEMSGGVVCFDV